MATERKRDPVLLREKKTRTDAIRPLSVQEGKRRAERARLETPRREKIDEEEAHGESSIIGQTDKPDPDRSEAV